VTLAELVRDVAYHNPEWRPSDVEQRARLLREAGLLPQGGRGRASPPVVARDVATLLVGLGSTGKAVEVVSVVEAYLALVPSGPNPFARAPNFGTALTVIFEDAQVLGLVDRVEMCRSWPEASIVFRGGKKGKKRRETYLASAGRPERRDQIEIVATVHSEMLSELGSGLAGPNPV